MVAVLPAAGSSAARYDRVAVTLHWIIALLILGQIGLGWFMVDLPKASPERTYFYALHKSLGLTTAFLILLRVTWRLTHRPPALPGWLPSWQVLAAQWNHRLLYACMVVMPVSGYLSASFTKYPMKWFGLPFPKAGWENDFVNSIFNGLHVGTSWLFAALLALHIAAGLKHLAAGDGVFRRILP